MCMDLPTLVGVCVCMCECVSVCVEWDTPIWNWVSRDNFPELLLWFQEYVEAEQAPVPTSQSAAVSVLWFMNLEIGQEAVFNFTLKPTSIKLELDHQRNYLVYVRLYCFLWGGGVLNTIEIISFFTGCDMFYPTNGVLFFQFQSYLKCYRLTSQVILHIFTQHLVYARHSLRLWKVYFMC